LKSFYEGPRCQDQLTLDKFFEAILPKQHRIAIANATNLLPMVVMPFVILLEERKTVNRVHDEILRILQELDKGWNYCCCRMRSRATKDRSEN